MKTHSNHHYEKRLVFRDINRPSNHDAERPPEPDVQQSGVEQAESERGLTWGSIANAPHTIADALKAAEPFIGENREWTLPRGDNLEKGLPGLREQLSALAEVLESKAQLGGVDQVNQFLREKGFSIQLDDVLNDNEVSAASVLDILVEWANELSAEKTTMYIEKNDGTRDSVAGVQMTDASAYYELPNYQDPLVEINTKNGYKVFMVKYNKPIPENSTSLFFLAHHLSKQKTPAASNKYKGLTFPMVNYAKDGDITELIEGQTETPDGKRVEITQAKYEHRLRMNEHGARAQAAAAVGMSKGVRGPVHVKINGSFIVWFEKDGIIPFAARITEEHMKEPESLE